MNHENSYGSVDDTTNPIQTKKKEEEEAPPTNDGSEIPWSTQYSSDTQIPKPTQSPQTPQQPQPPPDNNNNDRTKRTARNNWSKKRSCSSLSDPDASIYPNTNTSTTPSPSQRKWGKAESHDTEYYDTLTDGGGTAGAGQAGAGGDDTPTRARTPSIAFSSGSQTSVLTEVIHNSRSSPQRTTTTTPPHHHRPLSKSYYDQTMYGEYLTLPTRPQSTRSTSNGSTTTNTNREPNTNAQTFVLALAFFSVWSPQNLMAPNLTQMMYYFNFTPDQRDIFLGANIAFATGVLSLPISALLGFYADVAPSRKMLFAYTVFVGGIASICTGYSTTYAQLYFARFMCGGCMSGSVPIAFSMLGDFFEAKDRNAASSGLTAMMGAGILMGQVFSGTIGPVHGWQVPFFYSGMASIFTSLLVMGFVKEPVRGGKEKVLQDMIARGTKYDRKLTFDGFVHAMTKNKTNVVLMMYGFTTNIPWGIIFTFLNDYLSQEQGLSVQVSTFLVFWFGLGSALGGVLGGYFGTMAVKFNRAMLPLFMALSTLIGILPFLGLLDLSLNGPVFSIFLSFSGGCIANLPSVNVRPCLLNVNPPETRGASMTAANLMINVARGAGPSLVTLSQAFFDVSRRYSFNVTIIIFWCVSTVLLLILATTLPGDQDIMEAELARYANLKMFGSAVKDDAKDNSTQDPNDSDTNDDFFSASDSFRLDEEQSLVSIEDRMQSFDATAANESIKFIGNALREIGAEFAEFRRQTEPRNVSRFSGYGAIGHHGGHEVVWDGASSRVLMEGEEAEVV